MQVIMAERYRGKRVRFSGLLRGNDVANHGGLWMRIDGKEFEKALAFDNMGDRKIRGTTDWIRGAIVLDVPPEGERIYFGILLDGGGEVAARALTWEVVDQTVPVTDCM